MNRMEKYSVAIENLNDVIETHNIELYDAINRFDYILVENRLVWITEVKGNNLFGIEQEESLEDCKHFIKDRLKS